MDGFGTYSGPATLNAGLDLEMPGPARHRKPEKINGNITNATIDARVRKMLQFGNEASLAPVSKDDTSSNKAEDRELNHRLASESVVLLKNSANSLPTEADDCHEVALIGPNINLNAACGGRQRQTSIFVNPIGLSTVGWKYYIVFIVVLMVMIVVVYFLYPETKGYTLEQVAVYLMVMLHCAPRRKSIELYTRQIRARRGTGILWEHLKVRKALVGPGYSILLMQPSCRYGSAPARDRTCKAASQKYGAGRQVRRLAGSLHLEVS